MKKLKIWETAALLALCAALCAATWAAGRQEALAGKLIRLHVLAASDSAADQAAKLRARDAVLALLTPALADAADSAAAAERIRALEPALAEAARDAAGAREAAVTLSRESYPTRRYESFSLPAGTYASLRVELDGGAGRNWWCVVYPPLCLQAASELTAEEAGRFDQDDWRLLCEEEGTYEIRFRLLELWGRLRAAAEG